MVYLMSSPALLQALRASDGAQLWQENLGSIPPVFLAAANGTIYVSTAQAVQAVQASDGIQLWQKSLDSQNQRVLAVGDGGSISAPGLHFRRCAGAMALRSGRQARVMWSSAPPCRYSMRRCISMQTTPGISWHYVPATARSSGSFRRTDDGRACVLVAASPWHEEMALRGARVCADSVRYVLGIWCASSFGVATPNVGKRTCPAARADGGGAYKMLASLGASLV